VQGGGVLDRLWWPERPRPWAFRRPLSTDGAWRLSILVSVLVGPGYWLRGGSRHVVSWSWLGTFSVRASTFSDRIAGAALLGAETFVVMWLCVGTVRSVARLRRRHRW
jgi:hypothetical protein